VAVVHTAPDQTPLRRLLGAQLVTEQGQAQGSRRSHQSRQDPGAAGIRHETELGEALYEARRARRDGDVAGERDVRPCSRGDSVDRGNDRHGQSPQLEYEWVVVLLYRLAQIGPALVRRYGAVAEILTGAKAPSSS